MSANKIHNNKGNQSTINAFGRGFVMAVLNINNLLAHIDDLKFFLYSTPKLMYWLSKKRRLIVQSMIMKYICQDLRLLGRIALLMAEVVVVFVCIYGITWISVGELEYVVIEIIRPHSRPFFVCTWYKPPNSALFVASLLFREGASFCVTRRK